MILENITVTIPGETIGSLVVTCDLQIEDYEDASSHPDALIKSIVTSVEVVEIRQVKFHVFNKVDVIMTSKFKGDKDLEAGLKEAIVEEVEYKSIRELAA